MPRAHLLLLLMAPFAVSCGLMPPEPKQMYEGAPLPLGQVAVLSEGARLWLHVVSVDSQYVVNPVVGGAPFTKGLHVSPGLRRVKVKYLNVDGYSMGTVKTASAEAEVLVETQPGHTYVLRGRRGSDRYEFGSKTWVSTTTRTVWPRSST
jgi:hypothetical protein